MDYESNTVNTFMFPHPKKKNPAVYCIEYWMSFISLGICIIQIWCLLWSEEKAEGVNVGGVACWLLYEEGSWTELSPCLGYCISNEGVTEFQFLGMQVYSTEDYKKLLVYSSVNSWNEIGRQK